MAYWCGCEAVYLLTDVELYLPTEPTVNWLDLVRLIWWQLVVVHSIVGENLEVIRLLLRVEVVLEK